MDTLSPGTKLGRYEIRSKIGEGGMGEVYLAEDTQLHRKVALKVLPPEVAANSDRMRRFKQEAQAAAALNHPNIAHIYEIGEQAGGRTNEIDHRSDIFSFGCMLYEAVTGKKAFAGADAIDTLNKIIREPTPLVSEIRSDAPADLQRIIRRCLAKDPDDRYQTIKDVAIELKELRREVGASATDKTDAQESRSQPNEPAGVGTNSQQS